MPIDRDDSRTALILYGSETGNAQEVAEELGRTAERLHFVTHVGECDSVKAVGIVSMAKKAMKLLNSNWGLGHSFFVLSGYICGLNHWPG